MESLTAIQSLVPWISYGIPVFVLLIFALVFVPTIGRFFRQQSQTSKLLSEGVTAGATLLSIDQTGTSVSTGGVDSQQVRMQVQVQPAGEPPFIAYITQMVPALTLNGMQPGTTMLVRYNPANKAEVAMLRHLGMLSTIVQAEGVAPQVAQQQMLSYQILDDELARNGVSAPARVIAAEKTGITVYNGAADLMKLTVQVTPAGTAPFQTDLRAPISLASQAKVQPGRSFTVRYNPRQPTQATIEKLPEA